MHHQLPVTALLSPSTVTDPMEQVEEAVRGWLEQAVIGLNLCPFAKTVYSQQRVRFAVSAARDPDALLAALEAELQQLAATAPTQTDTTLLAVPLMFADFLDFHFFQGEVAALLRRLEYDRIFQVAAFHPQWVFAGSATEDIENCVNRAPVPLLHLLREDSVTRAISAFGDTTSVTAANQRRLRALGWAGWNQLRQGGSSGL
jgi:hypothetical protein